MESGRSHHKNLGRHPDRIRHIRRMADPLPGTCAATGEKVTELDTITIQLLNFIIWTEPHFVFGLDGKVISRIRRHLPRVWNEEKPFPDFFVMDCGPRVPDEMVVAIECTLSNPSNERRRTWILSDESTIKPAFDLSRILKGNFPWMDVTVHRFGQPA